ncbi:MAG: TetR/AcrR family transcriptional regulator [Burkholderiales bacterium]|nr:TetR/AcrR family transcriptional regulator [Burkholderiales bacterium]
MRPPASIPVPRRPGRPANQPGNDHRDRLLDAAAALFARQGAAATSLTQIARAVELTPAMVHYYFRTRDQLLDAVVDERIGPLIERVTGPALGDGAEAEGTIAMIVGLARRMLQTAEQAPWFPPLWIREIVSDGGLLRERMLQRFALPRGQVIVARIAAAQARGEINPALEPRMVFISVLGLTLLPLATASIWRRLPEPGRLDTDALARHVSALLTSGLGTPPTERDSS